MYRLYFLSLAAVLFLAACSLSKDASKFKKDHVILSLEKEGCPGYCSVYNVKVYKNRYAVYEGLVNVEKFGLYSRRMDKEEFAALTGAFEKAGFWNFQDSFKVEGPEKPIIRLLYRKKEKVKTVVGSTDRPSYVLELQQLLEKAGKTGNWVEVKKYEPKYTYEQKEYTMIQGENVVDNQLIIEPAEGVDVSKWITKYDNQGATVLKQISSSLNYWLIGFDKEKTSAHAFMKRLKADSEIKHVEFNRKVNPRDH